jgi:hypothetical protein
MADQDLEMTNRINQILGGGNVTAEACRCFLDVIKPAVHALCDNVDIQAPNRNLALRCITKRTQENLAMIVATADSEHPHMTTMPLRPLCEDLIFGAWLRTFPAQDADEYIALTVLDDILKCIEAQDRFLPGAYEEYGRLPDGTLPSVELPAMRAVQFPAAEPGGHPQTVHGRMLKDLGRRLGWPRGRVPSIHDMAEQCDLADVYDFFYRGSSKAVHANPHNMMRMVWGHQKYTISSGNFDHYYREFGLTYGILLAAELMLKVVWPEFPEQFALVNDDAFNAWLALVVAGRARNGELPPLVTTDELRSPLRDAIARERDHRGPS